MKKTALGLLVLALCFCFSISLYAQSDIVGQITYIDKQPDPKKPQSAGVTITRNSKFLADQEVDIGTPLQDFDTIRTGPNSTVELTLNPKTGIGAVLTLKPSTTLAIDITALKNSQKGGVNLLAGSVALKVQKMTGGNQLSVRTGTANMGVRGTKFEVTYAVSGDILLSTSEGRVECATDNGKVLYSAPGSVVQGTIEGDWSAVPVAVEKLDDFKKKWNTERIDAFRADPGRATKQFATRYFKLRDRFDAAYAQLFQNRDLILKWILQDNHGNIGPLQERNREKLKLFKSLLDLRKVNVMFERIYYRLLQLDDLYSQGIAATGDVQDGMSVADFFQGFRNDRDLLAKKFDDIQFITKLYAKRNDGTFPLDDATSADMKDDGAFFGSDNGSTQSSEDSFFNK